MTSSPNSDLLRRRMSGVLLHPTSLPGDGPVGTLGSAAFAFVDFLSAAHQHLWQMLPVVPTGPEGTPYVGTSAFALNTSLLDPMQLRAHGFLEASGIPRAKPGSDTVDFEQAAKRAGHLIERAFSRYADGASESLRRDFATYCEREAFWIRDYTLFLALKARLGGKPWFEWPPELALRIPAALWNARRELKNTIEAAGFGQFMLEKQFEALKRYAQQSEVYLVGDIPIYVSLDSADVWANQDIFELDERGRPTVVAGVPPDYFSATGQRWGNPLYRWDVLKQRDYAWWVQRFKRAFRLFDLVRIDHFRGFESYWEIPADEPNAVVGTWKKGPGADLFDTLDRELGSVAVIAEDLGIITEAVHQLRDELGFPGMKILQFAFDGDEDHPYLPENYPRCCVVYPGTHDNNTSMGWYQQLDDSQREIFHDYLSETPASPAWALIDLAWRSPANFAIATMQDLLELGQEARMNTPAEAFGNWQWRMCQGATTDDLVERLARLTDDTGRDRR